MSQVADLLAASRAAHERKKQHAGRADKHGNVTHPPNYGRAEAEIAEALRLRREAHGLDPEHLDPAWALDRVPHTKLMAFYEAYPSIP